MILYNINSQKAASRRSALVAVNIILLILPIIKSANLDKMHKKIVDICKYLCYNADATQSNKFSSVSETIPWQKEAPRNRNIA